jgi:2-keto-3-deoxy-6-phosphogluconate aldolase
MAFSVSSDAGIGGKLTVRVPTPEEALSRAQNLLETGSDQVKITVTATGDEFTIAEFASRMRTNTLPKSSVGR